MNYKSISLKAFAGFLMVLPQYVFADYRYTFISGPLTEIRANDNIRGNELAQLEPDDFMKIVINTTAAPMTQEVDYPSGANPQGYFVEATSIEMSIGSFYLNTLEVEQTIYNSFFIQEYDVNRLPTQWYFNFVSEPYGSGGTTPGYFEQIALRSGGNDGSNSSSVFAYSEAPNYFYYVDATAVGGQWTLEQISSPVPEVETHAMMMAGLGLIGFVSRKRRKSI